METLDVLAQLKYCSLPKSRLGGGKISGTLHPL